MAGSHPIAIAGNEPVAIRPATIGGVMEDPAVASTAALYDALQPGVNPDWKAIRSELRAWQPQVIGLLRDLAPGREEQIFRALLDGHDLEERGALTASVDRILRDNIDLARMEA